MARQLQISCVQKSGFCLHAAAVTQINRTAVTKNLTLPRTIAITWARTCIHSLRRRISRCIQFVSCSWFMWWMMRWDLRWWFRLDRGGIDKQGMGEMKCHCRHSASIATAKKPKYGLSNFATLVNSHPSSLISVVRPQEVPLIDRRRVGPLSPELTWRLYLHHRPHSPMSPMLSTILLGAV